jgi:hypothetical protein
MREHGHTCVGLLAPLTRRMPRSKTWALASGGACVLLAHPRKALSCGDAATRACLGENAPHPHDNVGQCRTRSTIFGGERRPPTTSATAVTATPAQPTLKSTGRSKQQPTPAASCTIPTRRAAAVPSGSSDTPPVQASSSPSSRPATPTQASPPGRAAAQISGSPHRRGPTLAHPDR